MDQPGIESERILEFLIAEVAELAEIPSSRISAESALVGRSAIIQSRELVELLLSLEDYAETELGVTFDWTSDRAMFAERSAFRTIGTLADHVARLKGRSG